MTSINLCRSEKTHCMNISSLTQRVCQLLKTLLTEKHFVSGFIFYCYDYDNGFLFLFSFYDELMWFQMVFEWQQKCEHLYVCLCYIYVYTQIVHYLYMCIILYNNWSICYVPGSLHFMILIDMFAHIPPTSHTQRGHSWTCMHTLC